MKKIKLNITILCMAMIGIIAGCNKEKMNPPPTTTGSTSNDVYITNEGSFGQSNGSVSLFHTSINQMTDDVFMQVNNRPLGDVVQSMVLYKDKGYIVVNNSQKIEVVDKNSFVSKGIITGFTSPRFFLPVNDAKAYVSDWYSNYIRVVNLNSLIITDSIPAGNGPEQMALSNNKVFVTNVGGLSIDSTVTVIDVNTDAVIATIQTGLNPNSIVTDMNNKVWVMCNGWYGLDFTGGTTDDVAGELIRINPVNDSIESKFTMGQFDHPLKMTINKNKNELYYLMSISGFDGSIYKFNITSSILPVAPLVNKNFYGLGIDPANSDIYAGYSPVFGQSGYMFRYQNSGVFKDSIKVGIGPNGFAFNY